MSYWNQPSKVRSILHSKMKITSSNSNNEVFSYTILINMLKYPFYSRSITDFMPKRLRVRFLARADSDIWCTCDGCIAHDSFWLLSHAVGCWPRRKSNIVIFGIIISAIIKTDHIDISRWFWQINWRPFSPELCEEHWLNNLTKRL